MTHPTSKERSYSHRFAAMWHELIGSPVQHTMRYTSAQNMMDEADKEIERLRAALKDLLGCIGGDDHRALYAAQDRAAKALSGDSSAPETSVDWKARADSQMEYSIQLQQLIERFCAGDELPHPNLHHHRLLAKLRGSPEEPSPPHPGPSIEKAFAQSPRRIDQPEKASAPRVECTCLPSGRETCTVGGPPYWTMCKTCGGAVNGLANVTISNKGE